MNPIVVLLAIAGYFAVIVAISEVVSRRSSRSEDFFTGGRRMPWPVVAFAMIGSAISGVTFISVPGMVVAKGYSYLQMVLGFIAGYVVIATVLVPLFYRRNLLSIYGYLEERFGTSVRRTGAWLFFISKISGASIRFYVVCAVLQILIFDPLDIPFAVNVVATVAMVWLYTFRSGVSALVWTDLLKSFCLIASVVLAIGCIASALGLSWSGLAGAVSTHESSTIFNFNDPKEPTYFWKQFVAGVFMAIAMNGLDQDMMQRHLSCRDSASSRKNMIVSGVMQFFVIALFLMLGTSLMLYADFQSIALPEKSDELFGLVATHPTMPVMLGIVFVIGLISAAYSAAGSALTSLTTSFTVDILDGKRRFSAGNLTKVRATVHVVMAALMATIIVAFHHLSSDDAISAVYTLASYTYGPLLGLFAFGLFSNGRPAPAAAAWACVIAPVTSWGVTVWLTNRYDYHMGFELLLFNALVTIVILGTGAALGRTVSLSPTITDNGKESF